MTASNLQRRITDRIASGPAVDVGREAAETLPAIIDALPTLIARVDAAERHIAVNAAYASAFGSKPEHMLGKTVRTVLGEENYGGARRDLAAALEGQATQPRELTLRLPAWDEPRVMQVTYIPQKARDGSANLCTISLLDITEQKRIERVLAEREASFRALFSSIDDGYCLCEIILDDAGRPADYRFLEANPLFETMTGLADAVGRTAYELVPDLEPRWIETYSRVALDGEALRFEDGSEAMGRWFDVFATPVEPRGRFAVVFRDTTERKRAEERLRRSEERFRYAVEAVNGIVYDYDPRTGRTERSRGMLEVTGYAPHEVPETAEWWRAQVHPEDRAEVVGQLERERGGDGNLSSEYRVRHKDGRWIHVWDRARVLCDEDGEPIRVIGCTVDMTERKLAETALRENEARFRTMADSAPAMLWVTDAANLCTFLNRGWYEFTGQAGSAGLGFGWLDAVHPEDREGAREIFLAKAAQREPFQIDCRVRRVDGAFRWTIDSGRPRFGDHGEFLGYIGSVIDVHERKQAEERQALLMHEVDHRAKNALAVVQAVVRLTRADNAADYADVLEGRIAALARAHTLLAESRWESAGLRSLLRRELTTPGEGRVRLDGEEVVLRPEAAQPCALAFHELATNALRYGALSVPGGRLEVTWRRVGADSGVLLTWRESGGPPVQPPGHHSFGSILVAAAIERQLGGTVHQDWDAAGLVCEIMIPGARLGTSPAPTDGTDREPPRVLVVEDDLMIALDVQQTLRECGFKVTEPVGRLDLAFAAVDLEAPDVVVLDANLAGESAAPLAVRLRELGIPFVIATGYAHLPGFEAMADAPLLAKPFSAEDLCEMVGALLRSRDPLT